MKREIKRIIGAIPQFHLSHILTRDVYRWFLSYFQLFICLSSISMASAPFYLLPSCRLCYTSVYIHVYIRSLLFNFFRSISSLLFSLLLSSTILLSIRYLYFLMVCLGRAMSTYRYRLDASHDIQPGWS